ncbi:MAG: hypothetical protein D6781_10055 [Verrucomicrobia bacterium]|nr:MAG: hypothetical protein D6781_10055 [Verrucomicrobiota bacterium]
MKADCPRSWILLAAIWLLGPGLLQARDAEPPADSREPLFTFRAEGVPMKQALAMFARANGLNIVPDLDIEGEVTVEFHDLPLDLAMQALLEAHGYYFVKDGPLIRVRQRETRLFHIDYIQSIRAGQGSSAVQISSGGGLSGSGESGGGSASGSESEGSTMTVTANATVDFWGDLREQLESMISEDGSVTINRLAGTVLVSDIHRNILRIADYLESITRSVVRQVDLEVQIYEIAFSNERQLGIDWSRLGEQFGTRFQTGLIVRNPVFGGEPASPGLRIEHDFGDGIQGVLEALEEQGDLRVVSKPRLRTLNNQPAVVRVGQDFPVFIRQSLASTGNTPIITTNETIQTVTVGTVLSITPQVSEDGLITLDLSPAVTRLVRIEESASGDTSAPVIDIRQASSIVRLRDGDTVVMGGLVQDGESTSVRKIPLLGDIPLLGKLFSGEQKTRERSELIFFLTPRIVTENEQSATVPAVASVP